MRFFNDGASCHCPSVAARICRSLLLIACCSLFTAIPSVFAADAPAAIQLEQMTADIKFLAAPERRGRAGAGKVEALNFIVQHFQSCGLKPLFDGEWTQTIPGQKSLDGRSQNPSGQNIGAFVQGTDPVLRDEWIIINAHYDHLGVRQGQVYPGADDNASGTAMVMEVARQIAAKPLPRSVAFVGFDYEESLLWGSRWFVAHSPIELKNIRLCITADMIGRSLGGMDLPTVFIMGAEHSTLVRETLARLPVPTGLEVAQLGADMVGTRSDYGPFRDEGIPFLFFSTGEHPDYHTPRDTIDKLDFAKATRVSNLILNLVNEVGASSTSMHWEDPVYQKLEEASAVHRITEQLLKTDAAGGQALSSTQKFFVTQAHSKTGYLLREQRVSDAERKWLMRTAQLLLLSVF